MSNIIAFTTAFTTGLTYWASAITLMRELCVLNLSLIYLPFLLFCLVSFSASRKTRCITFAVSAGLVFNLGSRGYLMDTGLESPSWYCRGLADDFVKNSVYSM